MLPGKGCGDVIRQGGEQWKRDGTGYHMKSLLCMGLLATLCVQQPTDARWHQAETVPLRADVRAPAFVRAASGPRSSRPQRVKAIMALRQAASFHTGNHSPPPRVAVLLDDERMQSWNTE